MSYAATVSNKEAKDNLKSGPLCAFPSTSMRSTDKEERCYRTSKVV